MQQKIVIFVALLICTFLRISATIPNDVPVNIQNENFPQYPNCGIVKNAEKGRILKGTEVQKHEFPFMVYVGIGCGGTLINSRWILTAAHCVPDRRNPNVYLGAHKCKMNITLPSVWVKCDVSAKQVTKVILHEGYKGINDYYRHDIALLKLKDPVSFSDKVQPICLPYNNEALDEQITDKDSIVSGWGRTAELGEPSEHLLKTSVRIWEGNKCQAFDKIIEGEDTFILHKETQLCAGGDGADTCTFDSGGPMFLRLASSESDKNMPYYQVGITSFGEGCGRENYPGVYTKVPAYLPWIRETILKNE